MNNNSVSEEKEITLSGIRLRLSRKKIKNAYIYVKPPNGEVFISAPNRMSLAEIEQIADEIELELQNSLEREVPSTQIGNLVMARLKDVDEVAYVRFASVYRQFKDINTFMEELTKLLGDKAKEEKT